MTRIIIIEDDLDFAFALKERLEEDGDIQILEILSNEADALKWFDEHILAEVDCALINLIIPREAGMKEAHSLVGLSIVEELKKNRLFAGLVLVLTNSSELADGERALAAGCDGYLCKHAPRIEIPSLVAELKMALTGHVLVISREMRHVFVRAELSIKESQIMEHLSNGDSWADIARKLGYKSSNAACTVAYRAFDKLLSQADLANLANSNGESKLEKAVEKWRFRTGKSSPSKNNLPRNS